MIDINYVAVGVATVRGARRLPGRELRPRGIDRANGSRTSGRTVPSRCWGSVRQATAGSVPAKGDGPLEVGPSRAELPHSC